jgi:hypothetical protein
VLGGLGHALEGVVEVDVAVGGPKLLEGQDHRQHRSAPPDPAFGEVSGQLAGDAIAHSVDERLEPRDPGHRVWQGTLDDPAI